MGPVQHPVVVITGTMLQLGVAFLQAQVPADGLCRPEIEGRVLDRFVLTERDESLIHRGVFIRVNLQNMVVDRGPLPGQVEEGMPGQVHHGLLIGGGLVGQDQRIAVGELVAQVDTEIPGIPHLPVFRKVVQIDA